VDGTDERIGDGPLVEADAGGVHLHKGRVVGKGRAPGLLGRFQHQAGGAGFAHAGRAVDDHVLRIGPAQNGFQGADPLALPHDVLEPGRPHPLAEGLAEADGAQALQAVHLPAALPPRGGLLLALVAQLHKEIGADDHRHQQLDAQQYKAKQSISSFAMHFAFDAFRKASMQKIAGTHARARCQFPLALPESGRAGF